MENEGITLSIIFSVAGRTQYLPCGLIVVSVGGRGHMTVMALLVFTPEYVSSCWGCPDTVIIGLGMTQYLLGWRRGEREWWGVGGGGYLVKCCVYISSCTNWSEGILSGDWERLEASNISPQLSLHNWKVCINNYVSALRCNSKRLQTSPPSALLGILVNWWHYPGGQQ